MWVWVIGFCDILEYVDVVIDVVNDVVWCFGD